MCDFWCDFCGVGVKDDRKKLGFYDTVVDTMRE
nr:MAG TPA: coiled coil protein [Caudoviricetes sp.]